jgi:hypothetical protein
VLTTTELPSEISEIMQAVVAPIVIIVPTDPARHDGLSELSMLASLCKVTTADARNQVST